MFIHSCSSCEKRQLIFPSQIEGVAGSDSTLSFSFTCWCGAPQTHLTGRADVPEVAVAG
ncbi:hypothetical protein [Nocardioides sambongensis]|uniref:hypothetical protein n=1 Tax=Nocardioides sambongensis TaxID=2589074 RepID=UPI0015E83DE2|nr:hypothetical protein [Nocardioides sambongensis]